MSVESEELARITKERDEFRAKEVRRNEQNSASTKKYYDDLKKAGMRIISVKIPRTPEAEESIKAHAEGLVDSFMA